MGDADGGKSKYGNAGAQLGLGYCDANVEGWVPSDTDVNAGTGKYGSCCTEIDIWEANKQSMAYTMHPSYTVNGKQHNTITDDFCADWVAVTQDGTNFLEKGGLDAVEKAIDAGVVLV